MNKVSVGVIGLGEVAQIIHLPILESLSERYEIKALCDLSPRLLRVMGERYGVDRLYTKTTELIQQEKLDAVFVLNSDEFHTDSVLAAVESGVHVLVEKPMCLTLAEADEIIRARDEHGVQVMVAYMRRFAPAFIRAKEEVEKLGNINYARVRDIIGRNELIIGQSSTVHRFDDLPEEALAERSRRAKSLVEEAIGEVPEDVATAYRLLCGLSSHDLSAMRELLGVPNQVTAASQWNGGSYILATFEYDGYNVCFETGVDSQRRFDAHIEVYGEEKSLRIQYDTPYIRHLPTTLVLHETVGDSYQERIIRPTFKDPYTHEIEYFHEVVTAGISPKTSPEDFKEDLELFKAIIESLGHLS